MKWNETFSIVSTQAENERKLEIQEIVWKHAKGMVKPWILIPGSIRAQSKTYNRQKRN